MTLDYLSAFNLFYGSLHFVVRIICKDLLLLSFLCVHCTLCDEPNLTMHSKAFFPVPQPKKPFYYRWVGRTGFCLRDFGQTN